MSDLKSWADSASLNVEPAPNGWPEGMPPSDVNNAAREMMAALRRSYVRQPWYAPGGTIVRTSTSQITIADDTKVTNYSNYYTVGSRVRIEHASGYVTGYVSGSLYEAPTSTITFNLDAEAELPAVITDIYVGLSPEDIQGIAGPNLLGCVIGFTEEGTKVGAGLLVANGEKFNPSLYPDLAALYYQGTDEGNLPVYRYGRELVGDVYWPKRPDVRGYFPRFADDRTAPGKDEEDDRIDPSAPRTVGSTQGDAIRNITGDLGGLNSWNFEATGVFSRKSYVENQHPGGGTGTWCAVNFAASRQVPTAEENRPKNIAMVGVIVAYSGVVSSGLADVSELEAYCTAEKEAAQQAATNAQVSANNAEEAAARAAASASAANASAGGAQTYAEQALTSADTAAGHSLDAQTAATNAAGSASSAATNAEAAATSATAAAGSAQEARDIVASVGTVMRYKGSVATYADLPASGNIVGDVWNVTETDVNYAWTTSDTWDALGGAGSVATYNSSTKTLELL